MPLGMLTAGVHVQLLEGVLNPLSVLTSEHQGLSATRGSVMQQERRDSSLPSWPCLSKTPGPLTTLMG